MIFDVHRLVYIEQNPNERAGLALRIRHGEIQNWEDLARIVEEARVDRDTAVIYARVEEAKADINSAMTRFGVERLPRFPGEGKDMAKSVGRISDLVGHKMYSMTTHGAGQSLLQLDIITDDGERMIHYKNDAPNLRIGVTHSAAEYLFVGTIAVAKWQQWPLLSELESAWAEIDSEFQSLRPTQDAPEPTDSKQ